MVSIPAWIVVSLIFDLIGDMRLSTTAFLVGGNLISVQGLLLLSWDRPPGIAVRPLILYSSILLFSLGAAFFTYSYAVDNASQAFYVALIFMTIGTSEILFGMKRESRKSGLESRKPSIIDGYSLKRARFWGLLIGIGLSLGIASIFLVFEGNGVLDWSVLAVLGVVLCGASFIGLLLDFTKTRS